MAKELKPCPFCGGEVKMDNEQITATITVDYFICEKCGATVHFEYADKTAESIEAWNTRKPIDEIVEQLEDANATDDFIQAINGKECNKRERIVCGVALEYAIEIVKGGQNE